jgi:biopolymer transport protein ExbD
MSLTSPLGLMRHVRRPNLRLEVVPWLNVLALGLLLSLLGSSYIYAPGLAVGLTPIQPLPLHLALTESTSQLTLLHVDTTLTYIKPYFYFDDGRHYITDLSKALHNYVVRANRKHLVLLLKINRDVPAQTVAAVCDLAHAAGFETVQWAEIPAQDSAIDTPASAPAANVKNP